MIFGKLFVQFRSHSFVFSTSVFGFKDFKLALGFVKLVFQISMALFSVIEFLELGFQLYGFLLKVFDLVFTLDLLAVLVCFLTKLQDDLCLCFSDVLLQTKVNVVPRVVDYGFYGVDSRVEL